MTREQMSEVSMMASRARLETTLTLLHEQLCERGQDSVGEERWNNLMSIAIDGLMLCRENRHLQDQLATSRLQVNRFLREEVERLSMRLKKTQDGDS